MKFRDGELLDAVLAEVEDNFHLHEFRRIH